MKTLRLKNKFLSLVALSLLVLSCGKDDVKSKQPGAGSAAGDSVPRFEDPSIPEHQSTPLNGHFSLVSDLDDTLKVTDVQSMFKKMYNAVVGKKAFAGTSRLIQELTSNSRADKKLFVMSGSPEFLRSGVSKFFSENGFPTPQSLILRPGLGLSSDGLEEYKIESLDKIAKLTDEPLVLIGDNVEHDPMAYTGYANRNPTRVAAIYIHVVKEEQPLTGVPRLRYFHTPFEVAVYEYQQQRMSEKQVVSVGEAILLEEVEDEDTFLPSFVHCPTNYDPLAGITLPTAMQATYEKVKKLVRERCAMSLTFDLAL